MDDVTTARAVHVAAVVLWIGGGARARGPVPPCESIRAR